MKKRGWKFNTKDFKEGTCFIVPLQNGQFARGIASRVDGEAGAMGYFFGPPLKNAKDAVFDTSIRPKNTVLTGRFSILGMLLGEWPILGTLPGWNREEWPLPLFYREISGVGTKYLTKYTEDLKVIGEYKLTTTEMPDNVCDDGSMGYGYVEAVLTMRLCPEWKSP
jgi:Immunity protein 26